MYVTLREPFEGFCGFHVRFRAILAYCRALPRARFS